MQCVVRQLPWLLMSMALIGIDVARARALSDAEMAILQSCNSASTQRMTARALGGQLGKELNTDAPIALIRSGCDTAMQEFVSSFKFQQFPKLKLSQPEVDAMVLTAVKEPGFFEADSAYQMRERFLSLLGPSYRSPELYQLLYDSIKRKLVESPTSLGPTFNGHWSAPDDLLVESGVPNVDERVTALLSLAQNSCQINRLSWLLQRRHYLPAFEPMREAYLHTPVNFPACDVEFTSTMVELNATATTNAILERLHWLFEQPEVPGRDKQILAAANAFTGMPIAAQVEQLSLKDEVRTHLHDSAVMLQGRRFFDSMEALEKRSREYTPESLSYWIKARSAAMVHQSVAHGVDVNVVGPRGETALLEAIGEGRADLVQPLVEAGADVNHAVGGASHPAPLHYALCARPIRNPGDVDESAAIVGLLLTHGARVHESTSVGITALQQAAGCGNTATLAALLAAGADVSDGDSPGPLFGFGTPLHYAARSHRPENVTFLLDHKAHINARTTKGATPLCWAVAAADVEVVRLLLNGGADVNLAVDGDVTPVFMAHEMGGMDVQRSIQGKEMEALLESHGAFLNPITVAKYNLLTAIGVATFLMDSGKSTY